MAQAAQVELKAPGNREEAGRMLAEIGRLEKAIRAKTKDVDAEIEKLAATLKKKKEAKEASIQGEVADVISRVALLAEFIRGHKDELTNLMYENKTANFESGQISLEDCPPSIYVRTDESAACWELIIKGFPHLVKMAINRKDAIKQRDELEDEELEHLAFVQNQTVYVAPGGIQLTKEGKERLKYQFETKG